MDPFASAVARLARAIREHEPGLQEELDVVVGSLRAIVARETSLSTAERDDVVAAALEEFVVAAASSRFDEGQAAGLLTVMARRRAIDAVRAKQRRALPTDLTAEDMPAQDDEIAALIDRDATAAAVAEAMKRAWNAGEHDVVDVVRKWLDLAHEFRRAPTTREAAKACKTNHTHVRRCLIRFREFVPRA